MKIVGDLACLFPAFVNRTQVFDLTVFQSRHHDGFQSVGFFTAVMILLADLMGGAIDTPFRT
jgi:hypothetical protein